MDLTLKSLILILMTAVIMGGTSARRKRQLPAYLYSKNRDPNVCAVQEVIGTGEQYFPKCLARRVHKLCGKYTFVRLQCCPGYEKIVGEPGCTGSKPLEDLVKTAENLDLKQFSQFARKKSFQRNLKKNQAYTIFVPNNDAISDSIRASGVVSDSTALYHVVPGRLNFSDFVRTQEYKSVFQDAKIRVNKYPNGVGTVNCARILSPNNEATNGIIHIIDQVLRPYEGETVISLMSKEKNKFSMFLDMIEEAELTNELMRSNPLTIFAPTNRAIRKLTPRVRNKLRNKETLKQLVGHHVTRKIICGDAIVISCGLTNMNGIRLKVSCTPDGHFVGNARLIEHDMVADNGIVHAVDTVLLPDAVKNMVELANDLKLHKFLNVSDEAGMTQTLRKEENFTLFAPTDAAFDSISREYMSALRSRPQLMKNLLNYHIVQGKVTSNEMVGQQNYTSKIAVQIKVNVFRNGIVVDDAKVVSTDRQSDSGVIHTIDKVLIPPEQTLMGLIQADPELSQYRQAIETAGLVRLLESNEGQFTVLAPTNDAFDSMQRIQLNRLMSNPELLKKHLLHHMVDHLLVPCAFVPNTMYNIKSVQGEMLTFRLAANGDLMAFDMHLTKSANNNAMAVNGILYKLNSFLHCECRPTNRATRS